MFELAWRENNSYYAEQFNTLHAALLGAAHMVKTKQNTHIRIIFVNPKDPNQTSQTVFKWDFP